MRLLCVNSILTLALLSTCCGRRDPSKPATSKQETGSIVADVHALEGDFIAALKRRRNWSGPDGFEKCVLEPETAVYERRTSWNVLRAELPGLERGTYDNFWSENERARPVAPLDRGAMKLQVMTKEEYAQLEAILHDDMQTEDYWEVFRKRYGEAVRIGLSAPGFSGDRKQALIYYEAAFDWLGSWGSYCLLKREDDRWEIGGEYCVRQS
jgi:hypothetical protein